MAEPKKKLTRARRDKRRSQIKFDVPDFINCPKCKNPRHSHQICPNCGFYGKNSE
ncbi:50S ribosomal protein L32 [Candidatus Berkelbacteria bacterium]|nr:50S ribosomal protein L32 [Candidatus Berkelbacteria bacterium]MBI4029718.1 50S ribosomal protein L32 [Candidatus Berkelbacteria bacterium]